MSRESQLIAKQLGGESKSNRDWLLYDSLFSVVSIVNNLIFFQQQAGVVGYARTNMKTSGMLPAQHVFLILEIMFKIVNMSGLGFFASDAGAHPLNAIIQGGYFEVYIEPSIEYEGHMLSLYEQLDTYVNTPAAGLAVTTLPSSFMYRTLKLKKPIVLLPNRGFNIKLVFTAPAAGSGYIAADTLFFCYLKGVLQRKA